jgi:hypothetical protein
MGYKQEDMTPERKREIIKTRFALTVPLFLVLVIMTSITLALFFLSFSSIAQDLLIFIVFAGIITIFIGAFYDFGAGNYVENVFVSKVSLRENDIVGINREQLVMTGIFVGVGCLFIIVAIGLFYLFLFLS